MTDQNFLTAIQDSFKRFIETGNSRSTAKLKPLHGFIAQDIANRLGDNYIIKSQGYDDDKEARVKGFIKDKMVDITIKDKHTNKPIAGIAVKFVMQNYKQNASNYVENMMGETSNIRLAGVPYFHVFIMFDKVPYFKKGGKISHWETLNAHNLKPYLTISNLDPNDDKYNFVADKTLLYVIHTVQEPDVQEVTTKKKYIEHYLNKGTDLDLSKNEYPYFNPDGNVVFNNYEKFINEVYDIASKQ